MRNSKILKGICYCLVPILVLIIGISLFYEMQKNSYVEDDEYNSKFFETDEFLSMYMNKLSNSAYNLIFKNNDYRTIRDGEYKICYQNENWQDYYYYRDVKDNYFIIIYKNIALTNVELTTETNTVDKIKEYIANQDGKKANIINGNVEANSEIIQTKALQHFEKFENTYYSIDNNAQELVTDQRTNLQETAVLEEVELEEETQSYTNGRKKYQYYTAKIEDFQIYSTYKEEIIKRDTDIIIDKIIINNLAHYEDEMIYALPIASLVLVIVLIYLIIAIGHSKNKEEIDLNDLDQIPIEIVLTVALLIICCIIGFGGEILHYLKEEQVNFSIAIFLSGYSICYVLCAMSGVTIIKRIKAKSFGKTSIICKCFSVCINFAKKIFNSIKKVYKGFTANLEITVKIALYLIGYVLLSVLLMVAFEVFGFIISLCILAYALYKFIQKVYCYKKIENHLKGMYEGDNSKKLVASDFTPEFQDIIKYINDISNGFENAIEEGIKSERLKTELITNVSHDIKTPLTSIINYVDLIKKEKTKNEKIKEYIEILDNKSQRLKKLTEDLVEASKASSGNVKLNLEKINVVELIKQSTGEFEDKFKAKDLEIVTVTSDDNIFIQADNRYIYRIIENLFGNIAKYALEASRVYIDINKMENRVSIVIKNISKERLNISPDELMQRFVRGDKSRTTEGSGLGISISKSLTELQKGIFKLQVDGDLFKVELEFDIVH